MGKQAVPLPYRSQGLAKTDDYSVPLSARPSVRSQGGRLLRPPVLFVQLQEHFSDAVDVPGAHGEDDVLGLNTGV